MQQPSAYPPRRAVVSWILFDWAAQPFATLVTTFVFAPYFANVLAETPAKGQELWGYATAAAGILIAVLAPVLGAIADSTGQRKPWILAFSIPFVLACWALWYAAPGSEGAVILALLAFAAGTIAFEFATVFNNSMMPDLVPPGRIGRLSGTGWAVGYAGGMASLILTLGFLAADPSTGRTLLGFEPLFGLDASLHEGDRAAGPLSALWYTVFVLPLFVFVPDAPKRATLSVAVRRGLGSLRQTLSEARRHPQITLFLLANMIYKDGLVAMFAFGGIYAAGQLDWGTLQIGSFGILLTITGTIGAFVGGRLDDAYGPKAVLLGALGVLFVCGLGLTSIDRDTVFFVMDAAPAQTGALFSSLPEQLFMVFGGLIGAASGPLQAASRSLLVVLVPREKITQYFGLLALSGKATSFLAPLAVSLMTLLSGSQAGGISAVLLFFVVGAVLVSRIRTP